MLSVGSLEVSENSYFDLLMFTILHVLMEHKAHLLKTHPAPPTATYRWILLFQEILNYKQWFVELFSMRKIQSYIPGLETSFTVCLQNTTWKCIVTFKVTSFDRKFVFSLIKECRKIIAPQCLKAQCVILRTKLIK